MKRIFIYTVVASSILLFSSCATIFTGSKKRISIDANVEKADYVSIDGKKYNNVTFPFDVKVKKGFSETIITAESDGYKKSSVVVDKKFNPVAVLNFFGLIGWGVDAATGAMMKPEYNNYELEFEKGN